VCTFFSVLLRDTCNACIVVCMDCICVILFSLQQFAVVYIDLQHHAHIVHEFVWAASDSGVL